MLSFVEFYRRQSVFLPQKNRCAPELTKVCGKYDVILLSTISSHALMTFYAMSKYASLPIDYKLCSDCGDEYRFLSDLNFLSRREDGHMTTLWQSYWMFTAFIQTCTRAFVLFTENGCNSF